MSSGCLFCLTNSHKTQRLLLLTIIQSPHSWGAGEYLSFFFLVKDCATNYFLYQLICQLFSKWIIWFDCQKIEEKKTKHQLLLKPKELRTITSWFVWPIVQLQKYLIYNDYEMEKSRECLAFLLDKWLKIKSIIKRVNDSLFQHYLRS